MIRIIVILVLAVANAPALHASTWYASPSATTGNGSITNPWSLFVALTNSGSIQPGDTLWLRGGTYAGTFKSTLIGTSNNPIIVRQYPGDRAILDGQNNGSGDVLDLEGSGTWFWGFEVMNSNTNRYALRYDGISANPSIVGANNKLINLIVHDNCDGIFLSSQSINAEVSGCIIYNNGYQGADRGHGHDYYAQNALNNGTKVARDNIMLNSFSQGIHLYGQTAEISGINVLDNIVYGSGAPSTNGMCENLVAESGVSIDNIVFSGNVGFTTGPWNWVIGPAVPYSITNEYRIIVTNNLSVAGSVGFYWWTNVVCSNNIINAVSGGLRYYFDTNTESVVSDYNTIYAGSWFKISTVTNGNECFIPFASWQAMGYDTHSTFTVGTPTNPTVVIQKNPYESGRAYIAIANWHTNDNVSVDVSGVLSVGNSYQVRNAADYFGAVVATGTYSGGTISLPMTNLSVAVPIGMQTAPAPTGPMFNAFVLLPPPPSRAPPPTGLRLLH